MAKAEKLNVLITPPGSWGLALATVIDAKNSHQVTVGFRDPDSYYRFSRSRLNHRLPKLYFPESIQATCDMPSALDEADVLVLAPPARYMRNVAKSISPHLNTDRTRLIVLATKGMEQESNLLMSEVIREELPNLGDKIGAISGPNLADELAYGGRAATDFGHLNPEHYPIAREVFHNGTLRVYPVRDLRGVELGGTLKNIQAIAAGICDGLEQGFSAKASLFSRAFIEMKTLGVALGAEAETFDGVSGSGDLTLCFGAGRNYKAGVLLARGRPPESIIEELRTVEGFYSVKPVCEMAAQVDVEVPIMDAVNAIVYCGLKPMEAAKMLMSRPVRF